MTVHWKSMVAARTVDKTMPLVAIPNGTKCPMPWAWRIICRELPAKALTRCL